MGISISEQSKLLLYADDSTIIYSHRNPDIIRQKRGQELENCNKWLIDNKLSLHLGTTECILFGGKRKVKQFNNFDIDCSDHTLQSQESVKYLGHVLDNTLSGSSCVAGIIKNVNTRLKFFYRHSNVLDFDIRKTLCNSLIQCQFDYACSAWFNSFNKTLRNKLQVTQNKVVRFISPLPVFTPEGTIGLPSVRPSVRPSVCPSVRPSVSPSVSLSAKIWIL